MRKIVNQDLLRSFAVEAKSYLPEIVRGISGFRGDQRRIECLEEAHRNARLIKGASSMVGLSDLSDVAGKIEECFENIAAGWIILDDRVATSLSDVVIEIGAYLEIAGSGSLDTAPPLDQALQSLQRLLGAGEQAPVAGVQAAPATTPVHNGTNGAVPPEAARQWVDTQPDIPADLLEVFLPEAEEYLRTINFSLPTLADQPSNREVLQTIRRSAHSLKGAAGTVGFQEVSHLAHRMEDLLDQLYDGEREFTPETLHLLFNSTDALDDMISGRIEQRVLGSLYDAYTRLLDFDAPPPSGAGFQPLRAPEPNTPGPLAVATPEAEVPRMAALAPALQKRGQFVRVPIEMLDEVGKLVAELIITRSAFEQNLADLSRHLEDLTTSATRLGRVTDKMGIQYEASTLGGGLVLRAAFSQNGEVVAAGSPNSRPHGFDDLEFDRYTEFHLLLRGLTEAANDIQTLARELDQNRGSFESCLVRQGRLSSETQDRLMHLRMVPLSTLSTRLHRTVRNVATQRGKLVRFVLEGEDTRLDKTVIDEIADPLLHILRNSIDHGIELPVVRESKGKSPAGNIQLKAFCEGTQIVIQITDDGVGLDPERLKSAAISGGYLSGADALKLTEEDIYSMIFLPGFTTAPEISEISGRGVGLDVVRVTVHRLKGSVKVDSNPGNGTAFTIRLPMSLAVMRALLVKCGGETYAIPLTGISHIVKIEEQNIERVGADPIVRSGNTVYPMLELSKMLNLKSTAPPSGKPGAARPVLLTNVDNRPAAIAVDETLGGREIVVKNLGNHLRQVRGVTGATLMGNGNVVLILNVPELVRDSLRPRVQKPVVAARPSATPVRKQLMAMVVDDSLSVRRVLSNLLSGAGWKPVQAKDGLDALEMIPHLPAPPDIVLLDIEMPRMDGYEFISALRKQKSYERLPIVVLTSRAGQKHRDKAFEVGATDYVVKPYQDEELLTLIRRLAQPNAVQPALALP
jgi:chemosensory pili system protein ChpA (sensor histidine kinase/response regulator)